MARSSRGAGKSLVRATLAIHEPPVGTSTSPGGIIKTFGFEFNPAQLSEVLGGADRTGRRAAGVPRHPSA
jgi:hypothetical protein